MSESQAANGMDAAKMMEMMSAMLAQRAPAAPVAQPMMGMPMQPAMWPAAQMGGALQAPTGVLFGVSIPLPDGREVSAYIQFGAEHAQNPQALQMLASQVAQMWPVRAYQTKQQGWGNGGGAGGGYNGGWNRNGGNGRWGGR